MSKKKLIIDRQAFCDWYFDQGICEDFFYNHDILESLKTNGVFKITLQSLLDNVGYIPVDIVEDGQNPILNEIGEVDTTEYDIIILNKI